jgi:hypothetical protein
MNATIFIIKILLAKVNILGFAFLSVIALGFFVEHFPTGGTIIVKSLIGLSVFAALMAWITPPGKVSKSESSLGPVFS